MIECSFAQIDEFSANPYLGNPVAMMPGADDLTDVAMQRFAPWTNLSETTFLLRPTTWSRTTELLWAVGWKKRFSPRRCAVAYRLP
jgi:PhzF family phenazine biosynthesis protein